MFAKTVHGLGFIIANSFCLTAIASDPQVVTTNVPGLVNSVHIMLGIDAERAIISEQKMLAEAQAKLTLPAANIPFQQPSPVANEQEVDESPKAVVVPVRIELLGIFGLGSNLLADVMIDNARVRFKRGNSLPLGASSDFAYRLVAINVPCVKIVDSNKNEHTACLSKSAL